MFLTPRRPEEQRHHEHEADLRHLAERHLAGGVHHLDLVEERVGEGVVELQRDADQERAEHEDGERPIAQQLQRVEAEHVRRAMAPRLRVRRRVREREAEQAEQRARRRRRDASASRWPRVRACRRGGRRRSSRSCRARGSAGNSRAGSLIWRNEMRVAERQRRHVAERVAEQHHVEGAERRSASRRRRGRARRPRCSTARIRSVARKRSATMPTKNGEIIAASAVVPEASPICSPEKPQRLARATCPSSPTTPPRRNTGGTSAPRASAGRSAAPMRPVPQASALLGVGEARLHFLDGARRRRDARTRCRRESASAPSSAAAAPRESACRPCPTAVLSPWFFFRSLMCRLVMLAWCSRR